MDAIIGSDMLISSLRTGIVPILFCVCSVLMIQYLSKMLI